MKDLTTVLPCSIKPQKDELFSSWLVRLANAHRIRPLSFYKRFYPVSNIWNIDIDKSAPDKFIRKLESKTLSTYEELLSTTLMHYEGKLYLKHNPYAYTKWVLPESNPHITYNNSWLVFCPKCLKKDKIPYFRKHWRLSISIICTECGVYLHEKCPNCSNPVLLYNNGFSLRNCYDCKYDLSLAKPKKTPQKYLKMQIELYRIMNEGWNSRVIYPHLYFYVLYQMLKIIKGKKLFINKTVNDNSYNIPFEQLSIDLRKQYLTIAVWILEDFPKRLIRTVQEKSIRTLLFKDFEDVPFWYHEIVVDNFFVSDMDWPV